MINALAVISRAFGLWWRELFLFILLSLFWLALQLPIITGPPATAAMYVIARRVADDELIDPRHGLEAFREMFVPAWKWGLVNLAILIPLFANFIFYSQQVGTGWTVLRLVWGSLGSFWFAVNIFYWPFWLAQSDQRVVTTLRNSAILVLRAPFFAFTLAIVSGLLIIGSFAVAIPLAAALMAWLALIGIVAVDKELERIKRDTH